MIPPKPVSEKLRTAIEANSNPITAARTIIKNSVTGMSISPFNDPNLETEFWYCLLTRAEFWLFPASIDLC